MKKKVLTIACLIALVSASEAQAQLRGGRMPVAPGQPATGSAPINPYGYAPMMPGQVYPPGQIINPYAPYQYPYSYSNPGLYRSPYGSGYPIIGLPQPVGGGYFGMKIGNTQLNMWKAPSGYYYPWLQRPIGFTYAPIVIVDQGQSTPSKPPLSTIFSDMNKFLDEAREKGKIADADYRHLKLRASDLQKRERSLRMNMGTIDEATEDNLRRDVEKLGEEVAYRVND